MGRKPLTSEALPEGQCGASQFAFIFSDSVWSHLALKILELFSVSMII